MTLGKHALTGAAVVAAVLIAAGLVLLPPNPATAPAPVWPQSAAEVRGVFHVHTVRSDGTGTVEEVAKAAAQAGLRFVILTDHGDATRQPDPPAYRSGVLCIDAVEISTTGGHYAAIGLGRAPYPLAGEPRDVAEDVRRLGGFGVVTHPLSPKANLAWRGWDVPFDAIEWLNGDSVWRDAPFARVLRSGLTYFLRPAASIATLYQRPDTLARLDVLTRRRRLVVLAGTDAHARLGFRDGPEPYHNPIHLRVPSYRVAFSVASLAVRVPRALSGHAASDARAIVDAIRAGHLHTVVDALAAPAAFEFSAKSGAATASEGDTLPMSDPLVLRVRANVPPGGWIVLFRDGVQVHRVASNALEYASDRPGVYRAEAWLPAPGREAFAPWIVGNPIYAGWTEVRADRADPDMTGPTFWLEVKDPIWAVEHDAASRADMQRDGERIRLRYSLGGQDADAPYAALAAAASVDERAAGISFRGSADRPMRVSVQLRAPGAGAGERWHRSVYLDTTPRDVVVPFSELMPIGPEAAPHPRSSRVRTLLFVVDTVNARPGASGRFTLEEIRFYAPDKPSN